MRTVKDDEEDAQEAEVEKREEEKEEEASWQNHFYRIHTSGGRWERERWRNEESR